MNEYFSTPSAKTLRFPLRSVGVVCAQLADLSAVREAALAYGTPDFASRLSADTLESHTLELLEELRAIR